MGTIVAKNAALRCQQAAVAAVGRLLHRAMHRKARIMAPGENSSPPRLSSQDAVPSEEDPMNNQYPRATLAAATVCLAAAFGAFAQAPAKSTLPRGDAAFLKKAAADGMAEVQLGQLAAGKAMRDEVKQFANRMVADHSKANDDLKGIAGANGVALPDGPDAKHRRLMAKLDKLSGGDFERAYMHEMVEDHRKDVREFRKHANSRKDSDVKAFAGRTLPTLQSHLQAALATNDIVQGPKRAGKRTEGSTKP
jgi:putative membrane protein